MDFLELLRTKKASQPQTDADEAKFRLLAQQRQQLLAPVLAALAQIETAGVQQRTAKGDFEPFRFTDGDDKATIWMRSSILSIAANPKATKPYSLVEIGPGGSGNYTSVEELLDALADKLLPEIRLPEETK
jgi:hypothetical protein